MKITKFYLNRASYIAEDDYGNRIDVNVDYWENRFETSKRNRKLENFAAKLLRRKHRVNFIKKLIE